MGLNDLIRQVAEESDAAEPRELAQLVAKSAPARQLRDLLVEAIVDDCRHHLLVHRNTAIANVRRTNHSPRLARQRDWWADFLSASEHVGNGVRKTLGDCTIRDLKFLIKERRDNIASIEAYIDTYETLASMLKSHRAIHVRDLPRDVVEKGLAA